MADRFDIHLPGEGWLTLASVNIRHGLGVNHDIGLMSLNHLGRTGFVQEVTGHVRCGYRVGGRVAGEPRHVTGFGQMAAERLAEETG